MSATETEHRAGEGGGNVYDKYSTLHPIERRLVSGFLAELGELVERTGAREAHEVGCGEGELALRLAARGLRVRGSDAFAEVIGEALAGQRVIAQRIFERVRRLELESGVAPSHYEPGAIRAGGERFRVETLDPVGR